VWSISIRTGLGIDGFSLTYMKLDQGRLSAKDSYTSEWVGGPGGGPGTIGGHGQFFVGVCGHLNDQGKPCSLGLVTVLAP
jgi:hypothetical protein